MSERASQIRVDLKRHGFHLETEIAWDARVAVIFGPSGSGKTTLLETVVGLHRPPGLRVRLAGEWLDDAERGLHLPLKDRRLGWVPQDPTLFPHLSVRGNLRFGMARAGAQGARALERAVEVLEIGDLLERPIDALSGGEQQRVAIARALASGPRALLLDEPLASLDLPLRARVMPYLLRIRDDLGLPMLYITHDPDEAQLLGGILVVLDAGRVVASGPPREVLWSRAVLPLSEALGLENVLDARVLETRAGESRVETSGGLQLVVPAALETGSAVRLGLRAENLLLASDAPGRISARNVLEAGVVRCEPCEGGCLVHLDAGEPLVAKVTRGAVEKLGLRAGARVYVVIKAQAIRRLA